MKHMIEAEELSRCLDILGVAERFFDQIGFEKTTVFDIAHELRMSNANVYRFFSSKAEITATVVSRLLSSVEASADDAANYEKTASEKLRAYMAAIEKANADRFLCRPKLHALFETAFSQSWPVARDHIEKITQSLSEIIAQGNRDGEFAIGDCDLAATLVCRVCVRFWHPRLMVEFGSDPEPTLDQMVDFCQTALAQGPPARPRDFTSNIDPRFTAIRCGAR